MSKTNQDAGGLPELPEPAMREKLMPHVPQTEWPRYYTADQMRAYAREAIRLAALTGAEPVAWIEWDGYGIAYSWTESAKRLPHGRYDLFTHAPAKAREDDDYREIARLIGGKSDS